MAKKQQQKKPKQIKLTPEEIEQALSKISTCNLDEDMKALVSGLINSNGWMIQQIQEGKLTIAKLRRLFACVSEPNKKKERKTKANKNSNSKRKAMVVITVTNIQVPQLKKSSTMI